MINRCYKFGYDYYGPFLLKYIDWLEDAFQRDKVENVFFFSRDGFMMDKAYQMMFGARKTNYVYFSRKSIRQALLYKVESFEESLSYLTKESFISFEKIFDYYGLDENSKRDISLKYGINNKDVIAFDSIIENRLLSDVYDEYRFSINNSSKEQAALLKAYIYQIGMLGRCAIVDIGWHGSMQFYLDKFFLNENIETKIDGYYVGIKSIYNVNGRQRGFLFDSGKQERYKAVMCFHGGYEKLFQSKEGSTIGYVSQDSLIVPQKKDFKYNNELISRINAWQEGALTYIQENKNSNKLITENKLINFGKNPPSWGIELFKGFYLDDGQLQTFVSEKPFYKYSISELRTSIASSVWKTGFLKSLFKIPGPYFGIYTLLKK